jgi:hypothetical protein
LFPLSRSSSAVQTLRIQPQRSVNSAKKGLGSKGPALRRKSLRRGEHMVAFNVTGCWTASSATKGVDQMAPGSRFGDKVEDLVRGATASFCLTRALS